MGDFVNQNKRAACGILSAFLFLIQVQPVFGATIQNTASGFLNGSGLDGTNSTVTLNSVSGSPVTSVVSEISPSSVPVNGTGNVFIYDILPTINGTDSGMDQIQITAPPGFGNMNVTGLSVGGVPLALSCSGPGIGEFCATLSGQVVTITLGNRVTTSLTNIQLVLSGDSPTAAGTGDFTAEVSDTLNGSSPVAAASGDADGDPSDANSYSVQVLGAPASSALAEISPTTAVVNSTGNSFSVHVLPDIQGGNTGIDRISLTIPLGIQNPVVSGVVMGNGPLSPLCPVPGGGEYCPNVSGQVITVDLGDRITASQTPVRIDFTGDVSSFLGSAVFSGAVYDTQTAGSPLPVTEGNADGDPGDENSLTVFFSQGLVLNLDKAANRNEATVGDVVTYLVELRNSTGSAVDQVRLEDRIPPNFSYRNGSTLINGNPSPDPSGNKARIFDVGTVPAFSDSNGNGTVDPGEPGYVSISYQLIVNSGATPKTYVNLAVAKDVCAICPVSNPGRATVTVTLDPLLDLGTLIGKVFEDHDGNGWQDRNEPGIGNAMVALDDGTYALTDEYGRYHFPAVSPGQRLLKINLDSMSPGTTATAGETRVVTVSPGLLAKANFGVREGPGDVESIGSPGEEGLLVTPSHRENPSEIVGHLDPMTVLINGQRLSLPSGDVRLGVERLEEVVEFKGTQPTELIEFKVLTDRSRPIRRWRLEVVQLNGARVWTHEGEHEPPALIHWDGVGSSGNVVQGGEIYEYQMTFEYADGDVAASAKRLFGVNQSSAISINLTGSAYAVGSDRLSPEAMEVLKELAEALRTYPNEKIIVEGHADAQGSEEFNSELSRRRAQAAVDYLVREEGIRSTRFIVRGYGESRPIASNETPEGRELNRRVELKGEVYEVEKHKLYDQYRTEPFVQINQRSIEVDPQGRFSARVQGEGVKAFEIRMTDARGRSIHTSVPLPKLDILEPSGPQVIPLNAGKVKEGGEPELSVRFTGRTDPGNAVELNGKHLRVDVEGVFSTVLTLKRGNNRFGLLIMNQAGYTSISTLKLVVSEKDQDGRPVAFLEPVPELTVKFPPSGVPLKSRAFILSGFTDAENKVQVNGQEIQTGPDGRFSIPLQFKVGKNDVRIEVTDPEGHQGVIERQVNVSGTRLFFLGFVDGEFGELRSTGNFREAGVEKDRDFYQQGRVAYYLKGFIAGKFLITSAFDSGKKEFNRLFKDLDEVENDRFLTNLDPDKFYPVYGDESTLVYDAQSQGKFYLAVDSEEFHLLVGNYPLSLTDTELAAYQRTLYGARASYQSETRTAFGQPLTEMTAFGAEVHQTHIRDELQATGGSLYYLSRREVIEGSEQVVLVVRDKNTGLTLSRIPQRQNVDYTIKYEEGRILFRRPISSVVQDGSLFDQNLLPGNPVSIQVDYETRVDAFEKTAGGGRIRQHLGDHISVGTTYITDELNVGQYELKGLDTEIRLSGNTRFTGEVAESSGTDSLRYRSTDGGLTFQEWTPSGFQEGSAWKVAAEVDLGEWIQEPDRLAVGGYFKRLDQGFLSSGNFIEQGTTKTGIRLTAKPTLRDSLLARYDREVLSDNAAAGPNGLGKSELTTVQWTHDRGRWSLTGEYHGRESSDLSGNKMDSSHYASGRLRFDVTERLTTRVEHQQTVSGIENDQTSLEADYRPFSSLTLNAGGTTGTLGNSAHGGAVLKLGEGKIYLTERISDDAGGRSTATVLGGETALGPTSKVYTEYQWEDRDNGDRMLSVLGAQREWDLGPGITFLLAGEHTAIDSNGGHTRRYTVSSGLNYTDSRGIQAKTRNEIRRERGGEDRIQFLTANRIEIKLNPDFTLLGTYRFSVTRNLKQDREDAKFDERSVGLAYRPVRHDRFNALARYTRLSEQGPLSLPGTVFLETVKEVVSVEWSWNLNRYLEWVEKNAVKIKREGGGSRPEVKTHTYLSIHRLNIRLWKTIVFGNEYRILRQQEADDLRQGWLTELAWQAVKHMRVGVGFNFTDFSDNVFSENDFSVYGWFIRVQGTF